jgi:formylglycine-generating enzyme required for sulfatase activity
LPGFYIDAYEVTNKQFAAFLNELGHQEGACRDEDCFEPRYSQIAISEEDGYQLEEDKENYPVTGVTWYGADAFCEWRGARLPLEAEWEMAASWDWETETKTLYPWGDDFYGDITNFCDKSCSEQHAVTVVDDGYRETSPVGTYEAGRSPAGAYDMGGNVWEWTADWFAADYYENSPETRPTGPEEGRKRVVRGGSWFDTGNFTSTVVRFPATPGEAGDTIGFRCAVDAER